MDLAMALGWTATFLFSVCYIPQIIKMQKTKSIEGLSFLLLLISFIANLIALYYATLIQQPPLQIKYILGILFVGTCLILYFRAWKKK